MCICMLCFVCHDLKICTCTCLFKCMFYLFVCAAHLSFWLAYICMNVSVFLAFMPERLLLIARECDCTWRVVRACKTDSVLLWTLDLLGTRWRQASCLPEPFYNGWENRSCLLTHLWSFETWREDMSKKTICFVYPVWHQVQESFHVEAFPVCFSERSWKL